MRRVTLRSLWEHKRRLVSTVLAIVLGVSFMTGTFVLADTIDKVFDDLFSDVNEKVDVQVQGVELFSSSFGGGPDARELLDIELIDEIRDVDGIVTAAPFIQTLGFGSNNRVRAPDGDLIGASQGPPTLIENWVDDDRLSPYNLIDGSGPEADDEIALNVGAAEQGDVSLGDTVTVISQFGESTYTVVGLFLFGEAESAAGAVSANFTLAEAQRLSGLEDQTHVIVAAGDGEDPEELVRRVETVLPEGTEALTGQEAAAQQSADVQEGFSFFRQILVVFGAIALIVGTFIIANTFSILVAQRTREMALLRAIGATRGQVLGSVLLEAAVIGLVAAVLGLLGGVGLAFAITSGLEAAGADLPTRGLVVGTTTVVTALLIGLGVTVVASVFPAVQATRVAPLAALRDVETDRGGPSRLRIAFGVLLLLVSVYGLSAAWRIEGNDSLPTVGLGAFALVLGSIVIGPVLAEPTVRVLGAALPRLRGITGQLATENAARSPKRTSATATALLIGVALIGFITIFAASASTSVDAEVERAFGGDLVVQSESGGFGPPGPFPASVADTVEGVDGVDQIARFGFTPAQMTFPGRDGEDVTFLASYEPEKVGVLFSPVMAEGDASTVQPGEIVVDVDTAQDKGVSIGDPVLATGSGGQQLELTVAAISDDFTVMGFWTIHNDDLARLVTERTLAQVLISVEDGADVDAVQDAIAAATAAVPRLEVLNQEEFIGSLTDQITSFLTLVQGLLLLSVIIAMIGIANTLSLSIHERTRELGLLRAVGMTRRQLRSAIRWEAVLIAVLGTVVGISLSLVVSWALVEALGSFGLNSFTVPVVELVVVVVIAAGLGIVAAIRPARRAARLDVLDAIAQE